MSDERAPGTRKPYRISKPREKWTESEHERFVAAINQHGRNWRKIVQEVGTRSVAQVRSHAQKYFLKLEKNGNTEEVPPARAKRPSTKPYPIKSSNAEASNRSSQSSQPHENKRPRRTERPITKPLHTDFTLLEESPGMSTDTDSLALLLSEEGDGSNNNMAAPNTINKNNSGSNGTGGSMTQRQSSALSTAELNPAACLIDETVPSPDSKLSAEALFAEREHSDPTDASSGAVVKTENGEPPNYGEFYNAVGKVFTNHQGSNQQLIQQLGVNQRSELIHMLDHLSGEMRDSVSQKDIPSFEMAVENQPSSCMTTGFKGCSLQPLPSGDVMQQLPCSYSPPGSLNEGISASNYPLVESGTPGSLPQQRPHSNGLLPLESQPSDLDAPDWRLGMSDDLGNLLPPPVVDYPPYQPSPLIDSKVFDY